MINSFKNVIGQSAAVDNLRLSFERNRLNHAYLLEGPTGVGRMTLARALAARFLCYSPEGNDACGECKSCNLLRSGSHPDYLELPRDCSDLRIRRFVEREGGTEKIEHAPVLSFMRLRAMMERGKVCVIPDAERMNQESANAFLKTLEEPPKDSLIIMTTSARDRVLSTIVSRCRRVGLAPFSDERLADVLVELKGLERESALKLAALGEGSLGVALSLIEGEAVEDWEWVCHGMEREKTPVNMVKFAQDIVEKLSSKRSSKDKREAAGRYFNLLALYVRRAMRTGLSPRAGYRSLDALWEAGEKLAANVRPELVVYDAVLDAVSALRR